MSVFMAYIVIRIGHGVKQKINKQVTGFEIKLCDKKPRRKNLKH